MQRRLLLPPRQRNERAPSLHRALLYRAHRRHLLLGDYAMTNIAVAFYCLVLLLLMVLIKAEHQPQTMPVIAERNG